MKPKDLGFCMPCKHCLHQLLDEMSEWCRTHCPTNNYNYAAVLPGQGPLHEVSDQTVPVPKDTRVTLSAAAAAAAGGFLTGSAPAGLTITKNPRTGSTPAVENT